MQRVSTIPYLACNGELVLITPFGNLEKIQELDLYIYYSRNGGTGATNKKTPCFAGEMACSDGSIKANGHELETIESHTYIKKAPHS